VAGLFHRPAEVRDDTGAPPAAVAAYPGARDAGEAVFEAGSGPHRFTGPALA
jgi:hypothetical protein